MPSPCKKLTKLYIDDFAVLIVLLIEPLVSITYTRSISCLFPLLDWVDPLGVADSNLADLGYESALIWLIVLIDERDSTSMLLSSLFLVSALVFGFGLVLNSL